MTLSYHDLRRWNPDALDGAAETVKARKDRLLALEDELTTAFGPLFWQGAAANAAREVLSVNRDRAEHMVAEAGTVQRALWDASDAVILLKNQIADTDATASANQFTIAADGSVTDAATAPVPPPEVAARAELAARLAENVRQILATAQTIDDTLAAVLGQAEAGEISDQGAMTPRRGRPHPADRGRPLPDRRPRTARRRVRRRLRLRLRRPGHRRPARPRGVAGQAAGRAGRGPPARRHPDVRALLVQHRRAQGIRL